MLTYHIDQKNTNLFGCCGFFFDFLLDLCITSAIHISVRNTTKLLFLKHLNRHCTLVSTRNSQNKAHIWSKTMSSALVKLVFTFTTCRKPLKIIIIAHAGNTSTKPSTSNTRNNRGLKTIMHLEKILYNIATGRANMPTESGPLYMNSQTIWLESYT